MEVSETLAATKTKTASVRTTVYVIVDNSEDIEWSSQQLYDNDNML